MSISLTQSAGTRPDRKTIQLLIVDDHAVVRQGLRTFLELLDNVPSGDVSRSDLTAAPVEQVQAARTAYLGRVQLHPEVMRKLMSAVAAKEGPPANRLPASPEGLTERELEVLRLIAEGLNNRKIADTPVISEETVKSDVSSILSKVHLEDRAQAAIYALRHGLAPDGA